MSDRPKVAIFWDYENCNPPSNPCGLGYDIVNNIGRVARLFGSITTFRAYLDVSAQSSKSVALRSELQSSGVSIIDCPHNGKKDVVDKMVLVDMLAFAVDQPAPATVILITGDRDYAYALSILKFRKYQVILVVPASPHTSPCLESQASLVIDWGAAALRARTEAVNSVQAVKQPYHDLDPNMISKLLRELQDHSFDDPETTLHPCCTTSQSASRLRRMSVRDLEPLRRTKNAGSFDPTQECTHDPASPRKSSTANDLATGGLHVSKTPSHSRRASVSTSSTRARSATIVAQSPAAVEHDIPAKNSPPTGARRSNASDATEIAGPAKRSLSVLPSLDVLEFPLYDSRPPSTIIIRSPLEPAQSTGDMPASGSPVISSSDKLYCSGSPFGATKVVTGLGSAPNLCSKQSCATVKPISPIAATTETPQETVTVVCGTPQIRGDVAPEDPTGLPIEDPERFIPRRTYPREGAHDVTNCRSYVTSHSTYFPLNSSVGLHVADVPLSKHVSPAPVFLEVGDGIDSPSSQFAALPRASNTPDHSARGSGLVFCSTTIDSHGADESERLQMRTKFKPLIHLLLACREQGISHPSRSTIATDLVRSDAQVYKRVGVRKFREYSALAEQAGIIELGGKEGEAWIALHPIWFGMHDATTAHSPPNRVLSPPLTGSKSPLIETAIFQTPTSVLLERASFESSNTHSNSPTDRQDDNSVASIPARFQPLIDALTRTRAEGSNKTLRSVVGQMTGRDVYAQAGVSGLQEYINQASEMQLVECGGFGNHAWIRLHPELRVRATTSRTSEDRFTCF